METIIRGGRLNYIMARIFGKYVFNFNRIDPFIMLMGNLIGEPFHVTTSFLHDPYLGSTMLLL